jgi:hypothetical protein
MQNASTWRQFAIGRCKNVACFSNAEYNEVRNDVRGCNVNILVSVQPKHQLTLFWAVKPIMVLR